MPIPTGGPSLQQLADIDNNLKNKNMVPLGTAAIGIGTGLIDNISNQIFGEINQKRQLRGLSQSIDIQNQKNLEMIGRTKEAYKNAELNPGLLYGMGGAGGSTATGAMPTATGTAKGMGIGEAAQLALIKAQTENIEANTANIQAGTKKTGVDTATGELKNAYQTMDNLLKEWDVNIRRGQRLQEAGLYNEEIQGKIGLAKAINELWEEGKLKEGAEAEINQKIENVGKTQEEREKLKEDIKLIKANLKGKELENAITELESKMQKSTGIDRNAPTWLKILGRMFVELTGK